MGFRSHQISKSARRKGVEPETQFRDTLFMIVLPLAVVMTVIFFAVLIARHHEEKSDG